MKVQLVLTFTFNDKYCDINLANLRSYMLQFYKAESDLNFNYPINCFVKSTIFR